MSVYVAIWAALFGVVVYQLLWTRAHKRNLDRHDEEMQRIYSHHSDEMRRIYETHR